jgi:large exoprotein involved in heme utilization and adhesion
MTDSSDETNAHLTTAPDKQCQRLHIGQHVLVLQRTATGGVLSLVAADGSQPIEIEITPSGPILRLRSGLSVSVAGPISLSADSLTIQAQKQLSLVSAGTLNIEAAGDLTTVGEAQTISARLGDVRVEANDDVVLRGERVKMNC